MNAGTRDELVTRLINCGRSLAMPQAIERIAQRFEAEAGAAEAIGIAQIEHARVAGDAVAVAQIEYAREHGGGCSDATPVAASEALAWGVAFGLRWERNRCIGVLQSMTLSHGDTQRAIADVGVQVERIKWQLQRPGQVLAFRVLGVYEAAKRAWRESKP